MSDEKKGKIDGLFYDLDYEMYRGVTTRHMCECNRKSCRRNKCVLCIKEDIKKQIRTQQKEEIKKLIDTTMYNVTNELMKQCVEPKDKDGVMLIMNKLNKELKQKIKEM